MKEIEANKAAWRLLSEEHYNHLVKSFKENKYKFSEIIERELGDIAGKTVIHLQCNTGGDSILLARKGAIVTGVDLVPDNVLYAKKISRELGLNNLEFFKSDIMELKETHHKKYDMVFTTEGVLCWLPDLNKWAETVYHLLNDGGFLYLLDGHPFFMIFDEEELSKNKLKIKYPYFIKEPEYSDTLFGYFSSDKKAENYGWMYTVSEIINSLIKAGLTIEYFNEYDSLYFNMGGMENCGNGQYHSHFFDRKMPFTFSLKARLIKNTK